MPTKEENILPLIVAYLHNELNDIEKTTLQNMLEEQEYAHIFQQYVENYRNLRQIELAGRINLDKAWQKTISKTVLPIQVSPKPKINKKFPFANYYKYAAVFIIFITAIYLINLYFSTPESVNSIVKDDQIVITLANGEKKTINTSSQGYIKDSQGNVIGHQKGNSFSYANNESAEKLQYNIIEIPYGKKFTVYLSDGTKVSLNAGSSIKYPQEFIDSEKNREVFVTGEAYFEVAKDLNHPFLVHSEKITAEVLGTHFNFRFYKDENYLNVVLVEGSVKLKAGSDTAILKPNDMAQVDLKTNTLIVENVFAKNYTAWVDGELIFRKVSLDAILHGLERHFNIEIENQSINLNLKNSLLNANFGNDNLKQVMKYLQEDFGLRYKVEKGKIIIY